MSYLYKLHLASLAVVILTCCGKYPIADTAPDTGIVNINIGRAYMPDKTKTSDPDEEKITDLNIFIFNGSGQLESVKFLERKDISYTDNGAKYSFSWLKDTECQIFVCANLGFRLKGITTISDLMNARYHMAYPDEYSRGLPMCGISNIIRINESHSSIDVRLKRMMAKISLSIDRSALRKNIKFNVRSLRIGGSPKSAYVFSKSKANSSSDVFDIGYMKTLGEVDGLNIGAEGGKSREVSLYMMENMQGNLLPEAGTEKEKILDLSDELSSVCSFIEMKAEYQSDSLYSRPGEYLTYRFYLGDSPQNFDVERNCHYHITVRPSGTGINEDSWRIDKTGLSPYNAATISVQPGKYIEGKIGDDIHIRATVNPKGTRLVFGTEELEYDKERGIYDYTMDSDGHGVILHLKKRGSGLLYIEAGAPVTASEMIVLTVN